MDETETRMSKIEVNMTGQDSDKTVQKKVHLRQDQKETNSKILYETKSPDKFSLKTKTRPRLSSFIGMDRQTDKWTEGQTKQRMDSS